MSRIERGVAVASLFTAMTTTAAPTITKIAELTAPPLAEVSGIARSSYPDVYWVHNDSGDDARIFAIDRSGATIVPPYLASQFVDKPWPGIAIRNAWNIDWEDITLDDGVLYIAEMGNNGNARRDLGVYVVMEPNPRATAEIRALTYLAVVYPDQDAYPGGRWEFDCEAIFADRGKLYFLTKHRKPGEITGWAAATSLYRLDTRYTDRQNTIFDRPKEGDDWLKGAPIVIPIDRELIPIAEALTWRDESTLLIANEGRGLFELKL